jgi:hypothetical protein
MIVRANSAAHLIEEQRAKIEPAVKKFQQECGVRTDNQSASPRLFVTRHDPAQN